MGYDYGNLFNNSFDSGFTQGRQMRDSYNKKKASEEIKGIRTTRLTEAAPTAEQSASANAYNEDIAAQDNATFGTEAEAEDYQYGLQRTQRETAVPMSEQFAQRAEIYGKHGLTDKSEAYTDKAYVTGRQEKLDANAEAERGLRVKGMERTENKAANSDTFNAGLSGYMGKVKSGAEVFNLAKVYEMGAAAGVDQAEINQNVMGHFNVDEATAKAASTEKLSKLAEAAAQGMDAILGSADPDLTDNVAPSLRTNKDGTSTVMYGGKELYVLPKETAELPQTTSLYMQIRGNIMKDPMMAGIQFMAVDKFRMDQRKGEADLKNTESQIGLRTVQGKAAMISANASATKAANAGAGGSEKLTALTGYANSLNTEVANLDRAMVNNGDPKSPEYKGFVAQRERALGSLQQIRQQIEGERFGMGGAQQGNPSMDDGTKGKYMTRAAQAVQSGKMTVEEANAELRARGVPELDTADFTTGGVEKPAPAPRGLAPRNAIDDIKRTRTNTLRANEAAVAALAAKVTEAYNRGDNVTGDRLQVEMNKLVQRSATMR